MPKGGAPGYMTVIKIESVKNFYWLRFQAVGYFFSILLLGGIRQGHKILILRDDGPFGEDYVTRDIQENCKNSSKTV